MDKPETKSEEANVNSKEEDLEFSWEIMKMIYHYLTPGTLKGKPTTVGYLTFRSDMLAVVKRVSKDQISGLTPEEEKAIEAGKLQNNLNQIVADRWKTLSDIQKIPYHIKGRDGSVIDIDTQFIKGCSAFSKKIMTAAKSKYDERHKDSKKLISEYVEKAPSRLGIIVSGVSKEIISSSIEEFFEQKWEKMPVEQKVRCLHKEQKAPPMTIMDVGFECFTESKPKEIKKDGLFHLSLTDLVLIRDEKIKINVKDITENLWKNRDEREKFQWVLSKLTKRQIELIDKDEDDIHAPDYYLDESDSDSE
jgi:hypothetical protein